MFTKKANMNHLGVRIFLLVVLVLSRIASANESSSSEEDHREPPKNPRVFFSVAPPVPENVDPEEFLEKNVSFVDKPGCSRKKPLKCLKRYTVSRRYGSSWHIKSHRKTPGIIGITYGQRVSGSPASYETTSIKPGEVLNLGYATFPGGGGRSVWIEAAWFE